MSESTKTSADKAAPLYFIQWLRIFLISLVVAHHAGQPYGPTGGDWPVSDPVSTAWLGPFFSLNAAFFMGYFFLISGYFVSGSYDKKGAAIFVQGRLVRLGIPLAFFTLFAFGPFTYLSGNQEVGFFQFLFLDYLGQWQIQMGHLWFISQLLAYCLLYALWRTLQDRTIGSKPIIMRPPSHGKILLYVLLLGIASCLVRTLYPQDQWVQILGLVRAEPAHLPQYISLFMIGIIAGRNQWLSSITVQQGVLWFVIGILAFVCYRNLPAAFYPDWLDRRVFWGFAEAFVCGGMILGLTVFFRRFCQANPKGLSQLDACVFGVYIINVFVLFGVQSALVSHDFSASAKFAISTLLGITLSFGLVMLLRRLPGIRWLI